MTRNLKALGLALLAVCAVGAVAAQGASAVNDEFHAAKEKVIATGHSKDETKAIHKFQVGAAGTVECNTTQTESTQVGTKVTDTTWKADKIVVTPHYSECSFGGQPATVNFNHCYYEFESETTKGNKTNEAAEHANFRVRCHNEATEKIETHTSLCTITFKPQQINHAVRYNNITGTNLKKAVTVSTTAEKIVVDKTRTTAAQSLNGCLTFPANGSAVGTTTGDVKVECTEDLGSERTGTEKTTPTGTTTEGLAVDCSVA